MNYGAFLNLLFQARRGPLERLLLFLPDLILDITRCRLNHHHREAKVLYFLNVIILTYLDMCLRSEMLCDCVLDFIMCLTLSVIDQTLTQPTVIESKLLLL